MAWSPPGSETPPQCLEYEVQLAEDQGEAKAAWVVGTTHTMSQGGDRVGVLCLMASSQETCCKIGVCTELRRAC